MAKKYSIKFTKNSNALSTRLCDLPYRPEGYWFDPLIEIVQRELDRRGIRFDIQYYFSNEWFCPENTVSIAIPFYLQSKKLIESERRNVGFVDGATKNTFIKTFRHELGHAIEHAFHLQNHPLRIRYFGFQRGYPSSYQRVKYSKNYVRNLSENYAQAHPDEDFAETFAVWLTNKVIWKKKYKNWPALRKLNAMDKLMTEIAGKKPHVNRVEYLEPIEEDSRTLLQYYSDKRRALKLMNPKAMDISLYTVFSKNGFTPASEFLRDKKSYTLKQMSEAVGQPSYSLEPLYNLITQRAKQLNLCIGDCEIPNFTQDFLDFMTEQSIKYIYENRHRIVM